MTTIIATAKIEKNGDLTVYILDTSIYTRKAIATLLEKSNLSVYNDYMIINDFKHIKQNEYTFTIKILKGDLYTAIKYSEFDLDYDLEQLIEDYKLAKNAANNVKTVDIEAAFEGMSKKDQEFIATFFKEAAKEQKEENILNDFTNRYMLSDEDLSFIDKLAA